MKKSTTKPIPDETDEPSPMDSSAITPYGGATDSDGDNDGDTESDGKSETEQPEGDSASDVMVPEVFQKAVATALMGATKSELEFARSVIMQREKQLMKADSKATKGSVFNMEGLPE